MTVSVLIPAYNADRFIGAALACVAAQTHADWELIVVEDGSHDATESLVRAFAATVSPRAVRYENLGENRGVAAARNRLLDLARGDAVAFLDADDLWLPGHLAGLVAQLSAGHALVLSAIERWDIDAGRSLGLYRPREHALRHPRQALFRRSFIETSSCVALPRATVEHTGRFDETLRIGEDRDYWFRALARNGTVGLSSEPTCRYSKHAGSSMAATRRVAADTVKFHDKHLRAEGIDPRVARHALSAALRTLGRLTRAENPRQARREFLRAWRLHPAALDLPLRAALSF